MLSFDDFFGDFLKNPARIKKSSKGSRYFIKKMFEICTHIFDYCSGVFWVKNFEGMFAVIHITPFENAQRWMSKNTFHFLLLNDDNMIGEH